MADLGRALPAKLSRSDDLGPGTTSVSPATASRKTDATSRKVD